MGIVVVGGGLAGTTVCRELRRRHYRDEIVLLERETADPYDRPPLSKRFLQGRAEPADIGLPHARELSELAVRRLPGTTVAGLTGDAVVCDDGRALPFNGLVIATGSTARRLPGQPDVRGVHRLRTLADALALRRELAEARSMVVVGGGFIGLEVAASAVALGVDVTVVERAALPLAHAIGPVAAAWLTDLHRSHGVRFACESDVAGFDIADHGVRGVELVGGERLRADVVLVGVGAEPETRWLAGSSVPLADGVVCDAALRAAPRIYSAGDVARWDHPIFGSIRAEHWTTAVDHARTVAANLSAELAGGEEGDFREAAEIPYFWTEQYDVKLQLAGWVAGHDRVEVIENGKRRAILYGRGDVVVAAAGLNHPAFVARQRKAIAAGTRWSDALES
ncbi:FAD-dependent oxidoreductase [Amycolatopsis sp. NPDC051061]|uniref:NAD(P)/FAD-dependent oxidoreductase n=1 Tax=Amycolatopsis sp. NPDC051061 TaxID=3155042 RepID=UPI003446474C